MDFYGNLGVILGSKTCCICVFGFYRFKSRQGVYGVNLKRIQIAFKLGISAGSLSNSSNKLQKLDLINFSNGLYWISEQSLTRWLNLEFKNNVASI